VADDAVARFPSAHPEDETQALPAGAPLDQAEVFDAEAVETVAAPDEPVEEAEQPAADDEKPAG